MSTRLAIAWLCNMIDTVATIHLYLNYEGEELNPISAVLLQSPPLFVAYKLVLMSVLVTLLWWKRDWKLCRTISCLLCIGYLAVTAYYLYVYLIFIPVYT